jgi:AraC-like DNA-binding protein
MTNIRCSNSRSLSTRLDLPRGTVGVRSLVQVAVEHGLTVEDCLYNTAITADDLYDLDGQIRASQEFALIRNVLAALGDRPGLGVETAGWLPLAGTGILGFAMLSSSTVRDAVSVGLRYTALSPALIMFSLVEEGDDAVVLGDDGGLPPDLRPHILERDLAGLAVISSAFFGPDIQVRLTVDLDAERGRALTGLRPLVKEIEFEAPQTRVVFNRALLDTAMPQADEFTMRLLERQLCELLQRRHVREGLAAALRTRLIREPGVIPSMEVVASEMGIDTRTLRRGLADEGTGFRALLDEVREIMAVELLAHLGLSVAEVAKRLGYAETTNFTTAFKRWRGMSPSQYRRPTLHHQ